MKTAMLIVFLLLLILIGPLLTIWSLNVLFPALAIPYTLETWLATILLGGVFKTTIKKD